MGRTVPWICWQEWFLVRDWLLSSARADIQRGIQRVEAWRARGRVPLGVDVTASLLETALCDASFWAPPAAAAAQSTTPAAGRGSSMSHQQLRLQYAATIVRMVNGIADSQQKGRVAVSVNSLAEAAGLSRLLVDVRHEATHNELPSLSTLQLAARQALDWLIQQYWQRQADHLSACNARVAEIVGAVVASCEAAAAAGRQPGAAAAAAADEEEDGDEQEVEEQDSTYKAAEGRKQRRNLLIELKVLLPPSHMPLLVSLLLDRPGLLAPAAAPQQQQQAADASPAARQAALAALHKQYPALLLQLLQEAVGRLCRLATGPPATEQPRAAADGSEREQQQGEQLLAWLHLLLPGAVATVGEPAQPLAADGASCAPAKPSSSMAKLLASKQGAGGGRSKGKQQQQHAPEAGLQHQLATLLTPEFVHQLLEASHSASKACDAAGVPQQTKESMQRLLSEARQLLTAALVASSAAGGSGTSARSRQTLAQLCMLAAPQVPQQPGEQQQQQEAGATVSQGDWAEQQQALVEAASQHQLSMLQAATRSKKRGREPDGDRDASGSAGAPPAVGRWRRARTWQPCAVGCLPGPQQPLQLLACLQAPAAAAGGGAGGSVPAGAAGLSGAAAGAAAQAAGGVAAAVDDASGQAGRDGGQAGDAAAAAQEDTCDMVDVAPDAALDSDAAAAPEGGCVSFGRWWHLPAQELQGSAQLLL